MNREESPSIERLKQVQRYPLLKNERETTEAIIEAILDLDTRLRIHQHLVVRGKAI